ncbi:MAG: hypothetical protein AAFW81_00955 [Pseudomonadota bacterium]
MKKSVSLICCIAAATGFASAQVPNNFQAGQPARAAEVNENFEALDTRITDNDARITANETAIMNASSGGGALGIGLNLVADDNTIIGPILDIGPQSGGFGTVSFLAQISAAMGDLDVMLTITSNDADFGNFSSLIFSGANCTGDAYVQSFGNLVTFGAPYAANRVTGEIFVSTNSADPAPPTFNSTRSGFNGNCSNSTFAPDPASEYFVVTDTIDFEAVFPPPYRAEAP